MFDAASLKELTAENYVEVSPAGEVDPRAKMLEFYAPDKKLESPEASVTEVDIRMFGDIAVIVAKIGFEMKGPDGKPRKVEMRGTFVAQNTSNRWKLVSAQYTGIRPPHSPS